MTLFRWVNYFFIFVFALDLILIVTTFTIEIISSSKIYALEWIIGYGTFFVIIPVSLLFLVFQIYIFIKREIYNLKDSLYITNNLLFIAVIILTISYSFYAKA